MSRQQRSTTLIFPPSHLSESDPPSVHHVLQSVQHLIQWSISAGSLTQHHISALSWRAAAGCSFKLFWWVWRKARVSHSFIFTQIILGLYFREAGLKIFFDQPLIRSHLLTPGRREQKRLMKEKPSSVVSFKKRDLWKRS